MSRSQSAAKGRIRVAVKARGSDEAHLIGKVARGDLRAFEEFYRLYHPRLTRFLANMMRRPELIEEVLNDTLMVVWRKADTYNGTSKVSTWVFAIAYRKALKALRNFDEPIEDKFAETRESPEAGPEQQMGRRQVQQALLGAMDELSADHRTVVHLTYFHEIGYNEIAEIMTCPVDTVKTRMFHARRRLKTMLDGTLADWL
jgi:RNA polymerase sigma factor (sigma-70 family)